MNSLKIIVIGSGPSGIAAATKLIEYGFNNIQILEAEDYVGGRIRTIPYGENILDMGAQWCHGEKNNVVYELATNYDKNIFDSTQKVYSNFNCIKSNKEIVPNDICLKLHDIIDDCIESDESEKEMSEFNGSIGEFLDKKFNEALQKPENNDIDKKTAEQYLEFFKKFECSLVASDTTYDISAKGYITYWECEGDNVLNWKGKGFKTILNILMKSTDDKPYGVLENKILLNKKVKKINWTPNDKGLVSVECYDNDIIDANHIICTVSLGVLKEKHEEMFNPVLPEIKQRAINGLSFGNVDKLYLEFKKPFWPENWSGVCLLWEDDDLKLIRKRNDNWIEGVFGFYVVDYQPNILCGWIVGEHGRKMESSTDDDVLNGCLYLLRKFLTWDVPEPKSFKRSKWFLNENFRGSYSYLSMRTNELNTNPSELAHPLTTILNNDNKNKPILQFAGEATHDHYYSTVHGAIESGWREANRLNEYYTNKSIKSHL